MNTDNTAAVLADTNEVNVGTGDAASPKRKVGRPANDPTTKLAQAKVLFLELIGEGKNRTEILDAFEAKLAPLTRGSAQVYYHNAKNAAIAAGVAIPKKAKAVKVPKAKGTTDVTAEASNDAPEVTA